MDLWLQELAQQLHLLVEQSDGTDVGSLRINNGRFIISGKHSSNPVQIQTHDGNEDIEVDPDGFIKMETAGAERLRIDASGKVGIGTASPSKKVTAEIGLNDTDGFALCYSGDPKGGVLLNPAAGELRMGSFQSSGTYFTTLYSNNAERMRIDSSGNAGS